MTARLFISIAFGVMVSVFHLDPVKTPTLPTRIRLAFQKAHPNAGEPQFQFSADDAGIYFLVEFKEAGAQKSDEYRYTTHDWLLDEHAAIAGDAEEHAFGESETTLMALDSGTHKR